MVGEVVIEGGLASLFENQVPENACIIFVV
jgi:hypothetical protein